MSEEEKKEILCSAQDDGEKPRRKRAEGEGSPKGKRIFLRTFGWPMAAL
jgi:hypothetical protein